MNGPGDILHDWLNRFGVEITSGCNCEHYRDKMNEWGPDKCWERKDTILRWLASEAFKRRLPYNKVKGLALLTFVLANAKLKQKLSKDA